MVVNEERSSALLSVVLLNIHGNMPVIYLRLDGLDEEREYRDAASGKVYSGGADGGRCADSSGAWRLPGLPDFV